MSFTFSILLLVSSRILQVPEHTVTRFIEHHLDLLTTENFFMWPTPMLVKGVFSKPQSVSE